MNPMQNFNKDLSLEQLHALAQLNMLLGGLGGKPASTVLAPGMMEQPQVNLSQLRPILGGTANG